MIVPFLALAFVTVDTAWALFVKSTLQHAVHEGVRYAVTSRVSGGLGHVASIKAIVQNESLGLLTVSQANTLVSVHFLDPVTLTDLGNGAGANQGGNLVEIAITGYSIAPLAPLLRSGDGIPVTVKAADKMEGSPGGVPPAM